jgi:hypothetical protein
VLAAEDALIVALGDFEGGELTTAASGSVTSTVNIRYTPRAINGQSTICSSEPFRGTRYTVCWYTPRQVQHAELVARQLTPSPRQWQAAVNAGREVRLRKHVHQCARLIRISSDHNGARSPSFIVVRNVLTMRAIEEVLPYSYSA